MLGLQAVINAPPTKKRPQFVMNWGRADRRKTPVLRQARQGFNAYWGKIIEIMQER